MHDSIHRLVWLTGVPSIQHESKLVRFGVPALLCSVFGLSVCSLAWYPTYYINQKEIWTMDLIIGLLTYLYLLYLHTHSKTIEHIEQTAIDPWKHAISFSFYTFFLMYWFYFGIVQFYVHRDPDVWIQLGNICMSAGWYLFFSVTAFLYYFICVRLIQRTQILKEYMKLMKTQKPSLQDFYVQYNVHHKTIKNFAKHWNCIIFFGFLLLTFHIPIDLISILYSKVYYDIPGFIIKSLALTWYTKCMCDLNAQEDQLVPYLYKHALYKKDEIDVIEKYILYRPIGLHFYGIRINGTAIMKIALIVVNLVIPTLYALVSNNIFAVS